jgi:hypothetical protein
VPTGLVEYPYAVAIALTVSVALTVIALVYLDLVVCVGVVPSVV